MILKDCLDCRIKVCASWLESITLRNSRRIAKHSFMESASTTNIIKSDGTYVSLWFIHIGSIINKKPTQVAKTIRFVTHKNFALLSARLSKVLALVRYKLV